MERAQESAIPRRRYQTFPSKNMTDRDERNMTKIEVDSKIQEILRSYTCKRKPMKHSNQGQVGALSTPGSPAVRSLSSGRRPRRSSISSSSRMSSLTSRKTSNASFCDSALSFIMNIQNGITDQQIVLSSTLNYTRNVVTPEQAFEELIQKFNFCNLESTSTLADMKIPNLSLTEGRLCGLGGLHTQGQVEFEERQDKVYLSGQVWADNLEIHFTWQHNNIRGSCRIKVREVQYRLGFMQEKDSQSMLELTDLRMISTAGIKFRVTGVGPLNWVLKVMVVKNLKKAIRSFVLLKFKEELGRILRRESLIDKLYIPILERKFSRK